MNEQIAEHVPVEHLPYAKDLVTCLPYAESRLRQMVAEAVGAASACWDNLEGAGTFKSEKAVEINDKLIKDILEVTSMGEANLGCATTGQLLKEVSTRIEVGHLDFDYRTVD